MENSTNITRGTIVFVKSQSTGTEADRHVMQGNHPAIVIQNEKGNHYSPNLIVCYLTSQLKRLEMKTHVLLQHYDNLKLSVVQTEQVATIDKRDVLSIVGQLRPEDMVRVDAALLFSLGLEASNGQ